MNPNQPDDQDYEILIPKDFCKQTPRAFLNLSKAQIISTIENPTIKERLTYYGFALDLFLKKIDFAYLFVIAIIENNQRRKIAEAFYIDSNIIDAGLSIPPIMWEDVPSETPSAPAGFLLGSLGISGSAEGNLSRLLMLLRKFLEKYGLKRIHQGEQRVFIVNQIVPTAREKAAGSDPNLQFIALFNSISLPVFNPSNHEKWEINFFAKHAVTNTGLNMYVALSFCIDLTLYREWYKSIS